MEENMARMRMTTSVTQLRNEGIAKEQHLVLSSLFNVSCTEDERRLREWEEKKLSFRVGRTQVLKNIFYIRLCGTLHGR